MRWVSACGVLGVCLSGPALAADLSAKAPRLTTISAADWSGFYVGAQFNYLAGHSQWEAATGAGGGVDLFLPFDPFKGIGSYALGLQAGYNIALSSGLMLGAEADLVAPNTLAGSRTVDSRTFENRVMLSGSARARIGYAIGAWLPYATGGLAWSYDRLNWATGTADSAARWRVGWAAGTGMDIALDSAWSARLEYLSTGFGGQSALFGAASQRVDSDLSTQSLRLGLNYRLSVDPSKSEILTNGIGALELDRFAVHGQTTFTTQYAFPFRAPYSGANSLAPNHGRETWDVTLYVGARLWEGAELWIDPEINQGFGLSGTFGVAGFPSGEAYKVGADYPYARLPRYFIRQTFDLGGTQEKLDGAAHQFAGKQSSERVVITAGKFAVTDIFDTNKYAHDPRSDFLNWGLADTITFDYAADAWAFTYGTAVEWYTGPWTLRAGVFDLPAVPNGTELDPNFGQVEMLGEIERRYQLGGRPGKIAVTGFLNRARLGRFDDAVALAQAAGTTPSTASVRRYTSKSGVSVNLEQQIGDDFGVFARAGFSDANLETNAFTDADRSVAAGVAIAGRSWGRPDDTFGVAGLVHHISAARIAYLNAGGVTPIIGDGKLPNPGNEQIIEAYYSLPIYSWRLTADYQFIANPAYNRDRGPVSVIATRLHAQF